MKINNVTFRGQYLENILKFQHGEVINVHSFKNGAYVATTQFQEFIKRLDTLKLEYESWHTTNRKNAGFSSLQIRKI